MRDRVQAGLLTLCLWAGSDVQPPQWFYDRVDALPGTTMNLFEEWCVSRGLLLPDLETTEAFVTNMPSSVYDLVHHRKHGHPAVDDPVYRNGGNRRNPGP